RMEALRDESRQRMGQLSRRPRLELAGSVVEKRRDLGRGGEILEGQVGRAVAVEVCRDDPARIVPRKAVALRRLERAVAVAEVDLQTAVLSHHRQVERTVVVEVRGGGRLRIRIELNGRHW